MNIVIDPINGYEQRTSIATIYGTFVFKLKYNIAMKQWCADIINTATSEAMYGVVLSAGRSYRILSRIGFGGTLTTTTQEDTLFINYMGL